jgi:small ligand-binding sensory domain FIST
MTVVTADMVPGVPVRISCGMSLATDPGVAASEAAREAAGGLAGSEPDLALVFAAGAHLLAPELTLEAVHETLRPGELVGCGASGILGEGREIEEGTAVSVWAADLGDGAATAFHAETQELEGAIAVLGMPELEGAGGAILLPDPVSFPLDGLLAELTTHAPGVPILGGVASAGSEEGRTTLFAADAVYQDGAVGVRLDGVELLPLVSQGARPIGPELTITAAEGQIIQELAGRNALLKLREVVDGLDPVDQAVLAQGLLLGIVVEPGKPEYVQGDFLVRNLLGADPDTGAVAVGTVVQAGQIVRLHVRDAASATRDLREALGLRRTALGGAPPAGALVFTCTGRGRGMFGVPDHDASLLADGLAGAPFAGFFAAGEIGPVDGANFLHTFTATVALFE